MTITTAVWLMSLTFTGTEVDLVHSVPFDTVELCMAGGERLGNLAIEISDYMYRFTLECTEVVTTRVML